MLINPDEMDDPLQRRITMRYVDGYVLPVPKKNLQSYRRMMYGGFKVLVDI